MGYVLQAVIASTDLLTASADAVPAASVLPLRQGLSLVPMTDELFDAVTDGTSTHSLGFWKLPGGFDTVLASWSHRGPVAYVEAEYFGGIGSQRAAVWEHGSLIFGPIGLDEGEPTPIDGSPISQALGRLGAVSGDQADEFDAVGLVQHRDTKDWRP